MAKLCVKTTTGIKKIDLESSGSVPDTGYDTVFTVVSASSISNTDSHLLLVIAYFRHAEYNLNIYADIVNNGKKLLTGMPVYNPGTDGSDRYPAGVPLTFLLLKGDTLKFRTSGGSGRTPSSMVKRVLIP